MNPFKLLKPSYLFDPTPGADFNLFWPILIFFILVFFASWIVNKKLLQLSHPRTAKEMLSGIAARMREVGILGLLLTFFRDQNVPYLGSRYLLVLLFLFMIGYGIWVWKRYQNALTKLNQSKARSKDIDPYLPKPKKKAKKKR